VRGVKKLVVGITGGVGCGKSTVAKLFETLGAGVVDTDEISHQLTQPGQPALRHIRARFGEEVIAADGGLNRSRTRELVFADVEARRDLESILHPLIRAEAARLVAAARTPYVVLVVPLLVETQGYRDLVARVLVVDCDERLQVERTMHRSSLTAEQVRAVMSSQVSREARLRAADDVIENNGGLGELAEQVKALHARYLVLARAR
jgi:dephospho-CoA kinase